MFLFPIRSVLFIRSIFRRLDSALFPLSAPPRLRVKSVPRSPVFLAFSRSFVAENPGSPPRENFVFPANVPFFQTVRYSWK